MVLSKLNRHKKLTYRINYAVPNPFPSVCTYQINGPLYILIAYTLENKIKRGSELF